ncbi:hypothetical protein Enr13x_06840 [Stieleria neptunia]|uniref:Uncharacterized protein n=1 Tax=Stieleria neptunia TaxID=2527979 RepID=A0A518HJ27_9BACT|nr:hypothetical protein Enr13x_06840 [Stieleria neptunia]
MNSSASKTQPGKKKRKRQDKPKRQRKPGIPSSMKPVMWIIGLVIGFAVIQTLIVLVKSH